MDQIAVPFMQYRGGSSRAVLFSASDLPEDVREREQLILSAVGRDVRQTDGIGGGHPLTSKVGVVTRSDQPDVDVEYQFIQVVVGEDRTDATPNCGNILSAVGPYAIETGMVAPAGDLTTVRVLMVNTGSRCELQVQTPGGEVAYRGDTVVDGVPGSAAPVICNYLDIAGSSCGAMLPTGNACDEIDGINVTCIDNGMPVVVMRAGDLGISGYEDCDALNGNAKLKQKIESIRLQSGERMGLGDVSDKVVPKMSLVAPPRQGGSICTRTFIPHTCHSAIGVLGAVSVATACVVPGSVAAGLAEVGAKSPVSLQIEHPSGGFDVSLTLDDNGQVVQAGLIRTARLLARGELYV